LDAFCCKQEEDCVPHPGSFLGSYPVPAELVIDSARTSLIDVEIYKNNKLDSSYYLGRIDSSFQSTIEDDSSFKIQFGGRGMGLT